MFILNSESWIFSKPTIQLSWSIEFQSFTMNDFVNSF